MHNMAKLIEIIVWVKYHNNLIDFNKFIDWIYIKELNQLIFGTSFNIFIC